MIKSLFQKEFTNETYLQELLQSNFNEEWLQNGLKNEIININHKNKNGDTFLIQCIKSSKTNSAKWLIENKCDVTIVNKEYKSALFIAIEQNNKEISKQLLDLNVIDLEQRDIDGRTLLQNIVMLGYNQMAKVLISNGANVNNTDNKNRNVLYDALSYADEGFIEYLLNLDSLNLNLLDENGNSIMHHVEVIKDDNVAKKLLIAGADPTIKNKDGESFLLTTALKGQSGEELIDIALENGADVNSPTSAGSTILMELIALSSTLSVEEKDRRESLLNISRKMLKHGGNINAIKKDNENGLFGAIRLCDFELISFLLAEGINPNIINKNKETALHLIIHHGLKELDIILLLLKYGANPNIQDKDGQSVYEILNILTLHNLGTKIIQDKSLVSKINKNGQYARVIKEILDARDKTVDLNYLDSSGNPLFFIPLLYGHFPLFKLYIGHGLDVNTINKANHNIFYEYVIKVFEENIYDKEACEKFQNNLSNLLSNKANRNYQDSLGWTVLHKIVGTQCNEKLFNILTKIVLFDYNIVDLQGRSVVHNAVWANKSLIIKKIYNFSSSSINITDNYGLLPITYAALLGNQTLVILFLNMNSNISGRKNITEKAIKKFTPMLKNLKKLKVDIKEPSAAKKIDILISQIAKDFKLI